MRTPLTTKEAVEKYQPKDCIGDCEPCYNCLESATCSMICKSCEERIWFYGSWGDEKTPLTFDCPYCGNQQSNPFSKRRKGKEK